MTEDVISSGEKLESPDGYEYARPIRRVAVAGGGTIGTTIALAAALAGWEVTVYNTSGETSERARMMLEKGFGELAMAGYLDTATRDSAWQRISRTTSLAEAVADHDHVVEAAPEDVSLKQQVFAELDSLAPPDVLLTSTGSAVPASLLGNRCRHPERILVTHFYLPAHLIPLVDPTAWMWPDSTT